MTLPAITIDALNPAPALNDNDLLIVRVGLQDYKATKQQVSNLSINSLSAASSLLQTDNAVISRVVGGGFQNFQTPVTNLGFLPGTVCWFRSATAPVGWSLLSGLGDRVLAVSDGTNNVNTYSNLGANGTPQGSWVQPDAVLNDFQIPNHQHGIDYGNITQDSPTPSVNSCKGTVTQLSKFPSGSMVNREGEPLGACLPHNHGSTYRPSATVGCLAVKL